MDIKKIKAEFKAKLKKYIFKNLNSYIIENFNESILDSSTIHILGTRETLKIVQMAINEETPGAYMRFGDGDVYLLKGSKDAYQSYDKYLAHEMLEAFIKRKVAFHLSCVLSLWASHSTQIRLAFNLIYLV